jgi:hypothetical protein
MAQYCVAGQSHIPAVLLCSRGQHNLFIFCVSQYNLFIFCVSQYSSCSICSFNRLCTVYHRTVVPVVVSLLITAYVLCITEVLSIFTCNNPCIAYYSSWNIFPCNSQYTVLCITLVVESSLVTANVLFITLVVKSSPVTNSLCTVYHTNSRIFVTIHVSTIVHIRV